MSDPVVFPGQLINPLTFPQVQRVVAKNLEETRGASMGSTVPAATAQGLNPILDLGNAEDFPFLSTLQAISGGSSPLTTSSSASGFLTPVPLLPQILDSESSASTSDDLPFVTPYQLGLQATMKLTAQTQAPNQTGPSSAVETRLNASLLQDLATAPSSNLVQASLPGALADVATLGTVDPTRSALFQALSGALASSQVLTPASTNPAAAAGDLVVMETYAGAATSAFAEGQPANSDLFELNALAPERRAPNASALPEPTVSAAPTYSPQGISAVATRQLGTALDLSV